MTCGSKFPGLARINDRNIVKQKFLAKVCQYRSGSCTFTTILAFEKIYPQMTQMSQIEIQSHLRHLRYLRLDALKLVGLRARPAV